MWSSSQCLIFLTRKRVPIATNVVLVVVVRAAHSVEREVFCFTRDVFLSFFFRHAFSEFLGRSPIALKLCHLIGIWPNFIMQVQKLGGWGTPPKKFGGQKHAKFRSVLDHYWNCMPPATNCCLQHIILFQRDLKRWPFDPEISRVHPCSKVPQRQRVSYTVHMSQLPWDFLTFFPKRLGIFSPNFTHLLSVPIYAGLQIFIQLPQILTKLCHIKCDHPARVSTNGGRFEHIMVVALNTA